MFPTLSLTSAFVQCSFVGRQYTEPVIHTAAVLFLVSLTSIKLPASLPEMQICSGNVFVAFAGHAQGVFQINILLDRMGSLYLTDLTVNNLLLSKTF